MAPKRRYAYDYPRPMVTADTVILRLSNGDLEVLLVRRKHAPHKGRWALPGGFIQMTESLEQSAIRELAEETAIAKVPFLLQIGAYGNPRRDPRGRVITVAFLGILRGDAHLAPGDDAADAQWRPIECVPGTLAFDHDAILRDALERLVAGGRASGLLFAFLPNTFSLPHLQEILDLVYGPGIRARDYLQYFLDNGLVRRFRGGKTFRYKTAVQDA